MPKLYMQNDLPVSKESLFEEGGEEKTYPAPSKMKKLVKQATLNGRYKPTSEEQLKKDYDKHVRSTLRDPKHSEAHKKE